MCEKIKTLPEQLFENHANGIPESFMDNGLFAPLRLCEGLWIQLLSKKAGEDSKLHPATVTLNVFADVVVDAVKRGNVVAPLWSFWVRKFAEDNTNHFVRFGVPFSSDVYPIDYAADLGVAIAALNTEALFAVAEARAAEAQKME